MTGASAAKQLKSFSVHAKERLPTLIHMLICPAKFVKTRCFQYNIAVG